MGLFNWLFGVGDDVEDKDGNKGKVKGFEPEGYVTVRDKSTGKTESKGGWNLKRVDSKKK